MLTRLVIHLILLLCFHQTGFAGQTYAVLIGISDYRALTFANGDLRYADQDARRVAAFLRSKAGGQVPAENIRLLTNRQADQASIQRAMALFRQAGPDDRVILYFSGHGLPGSFVPYDAQVGNPRSLLTHSAVRQAFHASKAATKLCIADACLSGSMTEQPAQQQAQSLAGTGGRGNVAMILASRSTQFAVEDGRLAGGAFTYFLLRVLNGRADADRNDIVTIRELHRYVYPQLKAHTKGRQSPVFYGRFSDNLALSYL